MAEHNGWINPWGMCLAAFPRSVREGFLNPGEGTAFVQPTALPGQHDANVIMAAYPLSELQGALDQAVFLPLVGDMALQGLLPERHNANGMLAYYPLSELQGALD